MSREQARGYVLVFSRAGDFIVTVVTRLYGFSGYRVQFWRPRTVPYKRVALYIKKAPIVARNWLEYDSSPVQVNCWKICCVQARAQTWLKKHD